MPFTLPDLTVPEKVTTPNALSNIASLTAIQGGQLANQKAAGTLDADIAQRQAESTQAQGVMQPNIDKATADAQSAQTNAAYSKLKLNKSEYDIGAQQIGGLSQDEGIISGDPEKSVDAISQARERAVAAGMPRAKAEAAFGILLNSAVHNPQALRGQIANIVTGGMDSSGQAAQSLVPASGQQSLGTAMGPRGTPTVNAKDRFGNLQVGPAPVAGQPTTAAPAPLTFPQGESAQTAAPLQEFRSATNTAAAGVPAMHFNNHQILNLADSAFTGANAGALQKLMSSFGLQWSNDAASNTAQLNHYQALQVEQNAAAQGANTDAARAAAAAAVAPGSSPSAALKSITKVNDAYTTGLDMFNRGMEATINSPSNTKDIFAVRDFKNQWAQNFDPNVMRLINAKGNETELRSIAKELGPDQMKALLPKYQAIKRLTNGQLQ